MNDSDLLLDPDLDVAILENEEKEEDFDDDNIDLDELVGVAETVEQRHATHGNISFLSSDPDPMPPAALPENTPSFHPFSPDHLRTWIYPTNYPIRSYQLNIVRKALFQNTLVALPTGLGKTFIAAVVMYNYWRWFPHSKVIFMAPSRPLVTQQIEACFSICGIPQADTTEMMGSTAPAKRRPLWQTRRVFFATPQTIQKDIESGSCPAEKISCVVVDEAHRATGNYAYSEVIRKLYKKNKAFRVLALTATPGSNLDAVQDVVDRLHIHHIQIRTEDSMDIREYSFGKRVERRIVRLEYTEGSTGMLPSIIGDYRSKVLGPILVELSKKPTGVSSEIERASAYGLMSSRLNFQATARHLNPGLKFHVIQLFLIAEAACRAHDLLCQHGIGPFLESIEATLADFRSKLETGGKLTKPQSAFLHHPVLNAIIRNLKVQVARPDFVGHPKLDQLTSIVLSHLAEHEAGSKVMVFSSWRSSVAEICKVLNRHQPIIRSTMFVGQSVDKQGAKGLKQTEQQDVIQRYKNNEYNVLVATSIGEEGLDIGEVDLIICFDSQTSPIRMLQRMGRTGRKRVGKCILLLTESEEKKFSKAKETYEKIQRLIARGDLIKYYQPNPTVLPANYKPTICRKTLTVGVFEQPTTRKRKKETGDYTTEGYLQPEAQQHFIQSFNRPDRTFGTLEEVKAAYWPVLRPNLQSFLPLQNRPQSTHRVGHSHRTQQFVRLIQRIEHGILHPETPTRLVLPSKRPSKQDLVSDFLDHLPDFITAPEPPEKFFLPPKRGQLKIVKPNKNHQEANETGSSGTGLNETGLNEVGSNEVGSNEVGSNEVGSNEVGSNEVGSNEVGSNEVGSNEDVTVKEPKEVDFDPDFEFEELPSWEPMLEGLVDSSPINEPMTDDDFGDLQDDVLAEAIRIPDGLDEPLEPLFPFETIQTIPNVRFSWSQRLPSFSQLGLSELEKRRERFKVIYGEDRDQEAGDSFELDFNDEFFTNLIENKVSDEGQDVSGYFEHKSSIYEEDVFEIDFDASFSEGSSVEEVTKTVEEGLVVSKELEKGLVVSKEPEEGSPVSKETEEGLKPMETSILSISEGEVREDSESPLVHRKKRARRMIISEDEQSPLSLLSLSKGLLPAQDSPVFSRIPAKRTWVDPTSKKRLKQRPTERNALENPFIDDEAEKSSDEGHTDDEEEEEGSSMMNSFIDDNSSHLDPMMDSEDKPEHPNVYAQESQPLNDRHWMNRFNADKWLNANPEDDHEVITEEEEEDESIQDFTSAIENQITNFIDDDDFM